MCSRLPTEAQLRGGFVRMLSLVISISLGPGTWPGTWKVPEYCAGMNTVI